jgi:hypothetical protein
MHDVAAPGLNGGAVYPELPGDDLFSDLLPSLSVFWLSVGLAILLLRVLVRRLFRIPWIVPVVPISVSLVGLALGLPSIAARHEGRWADLKQELRDYAREIRAYEAAHGIVDTKWKAHEMRRTLGWRAFMFADGPEVFLEYLWWHRPGRVGIVWGRGRTAVFDPDTMWCVYTD